eukprot:649459-Prorocentrum_minimum.AAC.1
MPPVTPPHLQPCACTCTHTLPHPQPRACPRDFLGRVCSSRVVDVQVEGTAQDSELADVATDVAADVADVLHSPPRHCHPPLCGGALPPPDPQAGGHANMLVYTGRAGRPPGHGSSLHACAPP